MEVREALDDKEHCHTDDGEEICCPVCGAAWLEEREGEFSSGSCQHLRFTLHSEGCDEFDFFGDWDPAGFQRMVKEAIEMMKMRISSIYWRASSTPTWAVRYCTSGGTIPSTSRGCSGDIMRLTERMRPCHSILLNY